MQDLFQAHTFTFAVLIPRGRPYPMQTPTAAFYDRLAQAIAVTCTSAAVIGRAVTLDAEEIFPGSRGMHYADDDTELCHADLVTGNETKTADDPGDGDLELGVRITTSVHARFAMDARLSVFQ